MKTKFIFLFTAVLFLASICSCSNDGNQEIDPEPEFIFRFSPSELEQIADLKSQIPTTIKDEFDKKYAEWVETWSRPEIGIHSNPFMYAESDEYNNLLEYCKKYGKATWPLFIIELEKGGVFVVNLLRDLTYSKPETTTFISDMIGYIDIKHYRPDLSVYYISVNYCKILLANEHDNIEDSIKEVSD